MPHGTGAGRASFPLEVMYDTAKPDASLILISKAPIVHEESYASLPRAPDFALDMPNPVVPLHKRKVLPLIRQAIAGGVQQ